jgi:hypothetical protein
MNLGQKRPSGELVSPQKSDEPKETFPSFTLSDKIADAFLKEYDCDLGDEITAKVKLKVSSLRKDEYGNSVGFEMRTLDDIKVVGEEDDEKESGDEKVLGYKPKEKPEAPDTSEADNVEE